MDDNRERLQKYMASCGVASRRKCEEYIKDGRVVVNGNIITEMGYKVGKNDIILVDGKEISKEEYKYFKRDS